MATLRDIKNRIRGVQNTQQITKAMKMIAATKLRRAQDRIINARPYAKEIFKMLSHLATEDEFSNNPYISEREIKNILVVVVTADRGLCGSFNSNIIKESATYIQENIGNDQHAMIYSVGKKGYEHFYKRDYDVIDKTVGIFNSLEYSHALEISNRIINGYLEGEFDKVIIVYNEFKSVIQQKIITEQFLPIPINSESIKISSDEENQQDFNVEPNYIYEPDKKFIFNYLLPKHLKAQLWRSLLESNAAEFGARMTAMDNATTNAQELIRSLKLTYNKERQAAITKEILEIVSGANALQES